VSPKVDLDMVVSRKLTASPGNRILDVQSLYRLSYRGSKSSQNNFKVIRRGNYANTFLFVFVLLKQSVRLRENYVIPSTILGSFSLKFCCTELS